MEQYLDKKTLTTIESPFRFDLRLIEHRHLTLLKAPTFPLEKKSGYTINDIAAAWGVTPNYLRHHRKQLLPTPDGKISGSLVWNTLPKRQENPNQSMKVPAKAVIEF